MLERIRPPRADNNHLTPSKERLSQSEKALHNYYHLLDKQIDSPDGYELVNSALLCLLARHYNISIEAAEQHLKETTIPLPLKETLQDEDFHRAGKEMLLVFPLLEFGDYIDDKYTPADAKDWYTQVSAAILERTQDIHDETCTGRDPDNSLPTGACEHSTHCPRRIVAAALTHHAIHPDFHSFAYELDPERTMEITLAKVDAACLNGLATAGLRRFYEDDAHEKLSANTIS
jgi:hypothetical protein